MKQVIDTTLKPGTIIDDRYTLLRLLGAGGCGAVWLAMDKGENGSTASRGADVVLKILHPHFDRYSLAVKQLEREAELLAQLAHPNIARPLEFSAKGTHTYLAMEFIEGRSLDQEIGSHARNNDFFKDHEVARLFSELCSAMSHAHSRTIIHRDIKPQNVMVARRTGGLFVKVLDFGIAKLIEGSLFDATTFGRRIGSMFYMAPEMCKGETADVRSDIFSLGVVLFEVVTLRRAWAWDQSGMPLKAFDAPVPADGANALSAVLIRVATAPRPKPSLLRPDLPKQLDEVLTRAMAIEPNDRYPTVEAFLTNFRRAMSERGAGEFQTEVVTVRSQVPNKPTRAPGDLSGDDSDTRLNEVSEIPVKAPDTLPPPPPPVLPIAQAKERSSWRLGGRYQPVEPTAPYQEVKHSGEKRAPILEGNTLTAGTYIPSQPPALPLRDVAPQEEIDQETKDIDLIAEGIIGELPRKARPNDVVGRVPQDQVTGKSTRTVDDTTAPRRAVPDPETTDRRNAVIDGATRAGSLLASSKVDPNATALSASVIDPNTTNPSESGAVGLDGRLLEPGATELMFAVADPGRLAALLPDENTPARHQQFRVVEAGSLVSGPSGPSGSVTSTSKTQQTTFDEAVLDEPQVRISPVSMSIRPNEVTSPSLFLALSRNRLAIVGLLGMVLAFAIGVAIAQWIARRGHNAPTVESVLPGSDETVIINVPTSGDRKDKMPELASFAHLDVLLERAREAPKDPGVFEALRDQISEAADTLSSETQKIAIKREAFASAKAQDVAGLEVCLKKLKRAARR